MAVPYHKSLTSEGYCPGGMENKMRKKAFASIVVLTALLATNALGLDKVDAKRTPLRQTTAAITEPLAINPGKTAVLLMDYQTDILGMFPKEVGESLTGKAGAILNQARLAKIPVIYVAVRFRPGYPEISPNNKMFSGLKESGRFIEGTAGAEFDSRVKPQAGDVVVTKRRVGAFSTTDLETILRAKNINNLVLMGISTSGVVLSTVRWAADMDYSLVVVSDACADFDQEVNRVLLGKVLAAQAKVVTSDELLKAIAK